MTPTLYVIIAVFMLAALTGIAIAFWNNRERLYVFLGVVGGLVLTGLIVIGLFAVFGQLGSIKSLVGTVNGNILATHQGMQTGFTNVQSAVQQNGQEIGQMATNIANVQSTANGTLAKANEIRSNQTQNYHLLKGGQQQLARGVGQVQKSVDKVAKNALTETQVQSVVNVAVGNISHQLTTVTSGLASEQAVYELKTANNNAATISRRAILDELGQVATKQSVQNAIAQIPQPQAVDEQSILDAINANSQLIAQTATPEQIANIVRTEADAAVERLVKAAEEAKEKEDKKKK